MAEERGRKAFSGTVLVLLLLLLAMIPIPTGRHGVVSAIDFPAHPDVVDDVTERWYELAISEAPTRAMDRVWRPAAEPVTSARMLASLAPGSDKEQSYVEFERGRLNADAVARRILGQPVTVRGIVDTRAADLTPGEIVLDVDGVLVPDAQIIGQWQDELLMPSGTLHLTVASPDDFTSRSTTAVREDIDTSWTPVAVSSNPVRTPLTDIIGGSAGLAQALAVLDALEPGDLTGGRRVAATGTITASGRVGAILSVTHKVRAARDAGVDVVFVPAVNVSAAQSVEGINVVGVRRIEDALTWLCDRGGRSSACTLSAYQWRQIARDPLLDAVVFPQRAG